MDNKVNQRCFSPASVHLKMLKTIFRLFLSLLYKNQCRFHSRKTI